MKENLLTRLFGSAPSSKALAVVRKGVSYASSDRCVSCEDIATCQLRHQSDSDPWTEMWADLLRRANDVMDLIGGGSIADELAMRRLSRLITKMYEYAGKGGTR